MVLTSSREWRTILVIVAVYGGAAAVVLSYGSMPAWASILLLAWFGAWHLSMQHEIIHKHPTKFEWLNDLLGLIPLTLWIPYFSFKREHLLHHDSPLTMPGLDSETYYVSTEHWQSCGPIRRAVHRANRTLLFRVVVWSLLSTFTFMYQKIREAILGQNNSRWAVLVHLAGLVLVISFVRAAGMPLWQYALGVTYGGRFLNLMRPFAEHEYVEGVELRTAMVQAGPIMSLLMLNNNLHVAHHGDPRVAWYDVPEYARQTDAYGVAERAGLLYRGGYLEIARRFGVRPFSRPVHPANY